MELKCNNIFCSIKLEFSRFDNFIAFCYTEVNGSQLAKMKEYSSHDPAIKSIGYNQLV